MKTVVPYIAFLHAQHLRDMRLADDNKPSGIPLPELEDEPTVEDIFKEVAENNRLNKLRIQRERKQANDKLKRELKK